MKMTKKKEVCIAVTCPPQKALLTLAHTLLLGLWLSGCSQNPALKQQQQAAELGFSQSLIEAGQDSLVSYHKPQASNQLHIYLDGDGSPWLRGGRAPATDPTPRQPLVLALMTQDPNHSIYLARPCYSQYPMPEHCDMNDWTMARYSEATLATLLTALEGIKKSHPQKSIWLIGFSGGGTLGQLLTNRGAPIDALVTVAANLDVQAWSLHHGYLPLTESISPADETARDIPTVHLIGGKDSQVPGALTEAFRGRSQATSITYPDYDHNCCWQEAWPEILEQLKLILVTNRVQ